MELETLFTSSRWEIIEKLTQNPSSPLQLSEQLNTSPANISQQIRLLEFAGLLNKQRLSARDSGKPRTLFTLKKDSAYIISMTQEGAKKELIELSKHKRVLLTAWLLKNDQLESILQKIIVLSPDLITSSRVILYDTLKMSLLFLPINSPNNQIKLPNIQKLNTSPLIVKFLTLGTYKNILHQTTTSNKRYIPLLIDEKFHSEEVEKNE